MSPVSYTISGAPLPRKILDPLSSLFEKTRQSNRLQMLLQRQHFLFSYFKDLKYWSGRDLNQRPTSQQTGSYPVELTELSGFDWFIENKEVYFRGSGRLMFLVKLSYMYSKLFVSLNRWSFSWVSLFMLSDLNGRDEMNNRLVRTCVRVSLFCDFPLEIYTEQTVLQ